MNYCDCKDYCQWCAPAVCTPGCVVKIALRSPSGQWYSDIGLASCRDISQAMKFSALADAMRVAQNLGNHFAEPFYPVAITGAPFGLHGINWTAPEPEVTHMAAG